MKGKERRGRVGEWRDGNWDTSSERDGRRKRKVTGYKLRNGKKKLIQERLRKVKKLKDVPEEKEVIK